MNEKRNFKVNKTVILCYISGDPAARNLFYSISYSVVIRCISSAELGVFFILWFYWNKESEQLGPPISVKFIFNFVFHLANEEHSAYSCKKSVKGLIVTPLNVTPILK